MELVERLKDQLWYLNGRFLSNPHSSPSSKETIKPEIIKFYGDTPNTIIYFKEGKREGYFRECRQHTEPRIYLESVLDDYCKYGFCNEHSKECKRILEEKLCKYKNFIKFFRMGAGTADYARINQFRHTLDSTYIGIEKPFPDWFENQLLSLVQFVWGALDEYKYNAFLQVGEYHIYNANRTMITKLVADIFNASEMVPATYYSWMEFDCKRRFGIVVEPSPGIDPTVIKKDIKLEITGELQRQLNILNIIDIICYQRDHRPGNYFVNISGNSIIGVSAFDNDCPTTLLPIRSIDYSTYVGCSSIVDKNGLFNRPFVDSKCFEKINSVTKEYLKTELNGEISKIQFEALWYRIQKLKKVIIKSVELGRCKLLDKSDWNKNTVDEEISGNYGMSYLNYLAHLINIEGE